MWCYENVSKYEHWDIRSALGQSAKQALLSKPCFPLTKPGRVWFGVDVTVYAISPSRKPKCTGPTLTQQNRTTGMWSDEEGSCTSSGHWFPFHGLSPPRQTNSPQAGSHSGCSVAPRQGSTAHLGAPTHYWPQNAPVDMGPVQIPETSLWAQGCCCMTVISSSFPLSGLLLLSPKPTVSLCFPHTLLPPDPHHERNFLILSHSPTSCTSQLWAVMCECQLWHFWLVMNSCSSLL